MISNELKELLSKADALAGQAQDSRVDVNFQGALLYGKFLKKRHRKTGLEKAREIIKERTDQTPQKELYFKALPLGVVLYMDIITREWLVIYLGEYLDQH